MFNEILTIPCFGFSENLFKNQVKFEKLMEIEDNVENDETKESVKFKHSTVFDYSQESFYRIP
jgi:hypothetical protein